MSVPEILDLLLGGGLVAALVSVITLRSTLREARAKADEAHAAAETVKITNTEHATRILVQNIVEPLTKELNETREELSLYKKEMSRLLNAQKREMARLRKAIDGANACDHRDSCPVIDRLRDEKTDADGEPSVVVDPDGVADGNGQRVGEC